MFFLQNKPYYSSSDGLSSLVGISPYEHDHLPSAEVIQSVIASAPINSDNPAEGKAANSILTVIYHEEYQVPFFNCAFNHSSTCTCKLNNFFIMIVIRWNWKSGPN